MKKTCPTKIFRKFSRVNPGFTLIEILVAVSVSVILFTIGIAQYNRFNRQQILNQAALTLKNNLQMVRDRALTGEKDCTGTLGGYLVTFSASSYSFQSQCDSSYGAQTTINLPSSISLFPVPFPILFRVLGQGTNISGSNNIILQGFGLTQTIIVTSTGEIK